MKINLLLFLTIVFATNPILAQPETPPAQSVSKELQQYYEKGTSPPWADAIKRLTADKTDDRAAAAKYLVALLDQAQTDELSGKSPWRATPFWGSRGENPARNLRKEVAEELAKAAGSPATLSVMRWYLDHEKAARHQEAVLPALDKSPAKEAGEFCLSLLQPPHDDAVVVLAALQQVSKRKIDVPDAVLKELCHHYRPSLRTAARKLNSERGGADPGPFDRAKAMERPAVAALMTSIGALLDRPAPPDAEFVNVTTTWTEGKKSQSSSALGWLVKSDGDSWVVLTPFGHRQAFQKDSKFGDGTITNAWKQHPIADEVKRVVEQREKDDPDFALSERGGLTGQFQGRGAGVYEVMLAHWLYTAKQFDLSAQIFLPALDSVYMDRHVVDMIRHRIGDIAGHRMLVAFAGERDFAETQRLAESLVQRYPGTRFHDMAVKLSQEMPKRQDDFKKLKLPTPAEWAELKTKLTRPEQIAYLAERLRLLNCFQSGQPGGYDITDRQFAEPGGLSRDAAWGGRLGKSRVVNPYVELVGGREGRLGGDDEAKPPSKGLELTVGDIPDLTPFLKDDWHLLCVSFWRNFTPDRHVDTTRPLVTGIINGIAKKDICSANEMEGMTPAQQDEYVKRIVDWAAKNAGKTEGTLLLEGLESEWQPGRAHWYFLKTRLTRLAELKEKGTVLMLHRRLDDPKSTADDIPWILSFGRQMDAESFKQKAERLLNHADVGVRQQAALLLHATGERQESYEAFGQILEGERLGYVGELQSGEIVHALLKENTPAARDVVRRMFKNPKLIDADGRDWLLRTCAKANMPESYDFYLPLLDVKGNRVGGHQWGVGVVAGEVVAKEWLWFFAREDPDYERFVAAHEEARDQIEPLKEWLRAKAKEARTAKSAK